MPSRRCSRGVLSSPSQTGAQLCRGEGFGPDPAGWEGLGHGVLGLALLQLPHRPLPRAGSLFTLTVERELEGGRRQHSALRILVSPGATGPCPRLYVPGLSRVPAPAHLRACCGSGNSTLGGEAGGTPQWEPVAGSQGSVITPWGHGPGDMCGQPILGLLWVGAQPAWHCQSHPSPGVCLPMCRECREPDAVCLPWIMERLLEGNSLTFLLLCVSLPGSPWDWDTLCMPPP